MARVCVFCGGRPVTAEHVFPAWIGRLFSDEVVEFEHILELPNTEADVLRRPWSARPFSTRAGGPCRSCNSGWMSELEQTVAPLLTPLIRGMDARLGPTDQATVATWAVKTMLMLLLVTAEDSRELSADAYSWLYRHRAPPPGEQVWLAHYAGEGQWPAAFGYHAIGVAPPGEDFASVPNAHAASFAVGHLAVGLAGHTLPGGPVAVPDVPPETIRAIWPAYGDAVDLPPSTSLAGGAELRSLATPREWTGAHA